MMSGIVEEYYKNSLNNFVMEDAHISRHEGNSLCGDDITIYLKVSADKKISAFSFSGNCSMITKSAASFLSEIIIEKPLPEILSRNYDTMVSEGFEVSPRRKRAAVIAILAVRNAIHHYLNDNTIDQFDDLIEDY